MSALTSRASLRRMPRAPVEVAGAPAFRFRSRPTGVALENLLSDIVLRFDVEGYRDFTDASAGIGRTSRHHGRALTCTDLRRLLVRW